MSRRFRVVQRAFRDPDVTEVVPEGEVDVRYNLWRGTPPPPPPEHRGIAVPESAGSEGDETVWLERRPTGVFLPELELPLAPRSAATVAAFLADALAALHGAGRAHGEVAASRVVIGLDGMPVWCGVGRRRGEPKSDRQAFEVLVVALFGSEPSAPFDDDLMAWAHQLRESRRLLPSPQVDLARQAQQRFAPVRSDAPVVEVELSDASSPVDEVGVDLGPDDQGRGLLDRWAKTTTDGESREHTGTFSVGEEAEQRRLVLLSRIAANPLRHAPPDRFLEDAPALHLLDVATAEIPDPLPVADGIPMGPMAPMNDSAEVTATITRMSPDAPPPEALQQVRPERENREMTVTVTERAPMPAPRSRPPRPATRTGPSTGIIVAAVLSAAVAGAAIMWLVIAALGGL